MRSLNDFTALSLSEKIRFFDNAIIGAFLELEDIQLNRFFKKILLDDEENKYVKKKALHCYVDIALMNKIKPRQALGLLIDDWQYSEDVFLELERLISLFAFYDFEPVTISKIYSEQLGNDEIELAAECAIRLGMIELQKGMLCSEKKEGILHFIESYNRFSIADQLVENRIDARIYTLVSSVLLQLSEGRTGGVELTLKAIGNLLFQMDANSLSVLQTGLYIGLYRILTNLQKIIKENPNNWLDFREGMHNLHYQYSLIENEVLSRRLNEGGIINAFKSLIDNKFLAPYFTLNFSAQISKIRSRIKELSDISEISFLENILSLAIDESGKKKVEQDSVRDKFLQFFPDRSEKNIDAVLSEISDYNNIGEVLYAYEQLSSPSISRFKDDLIAACLKMQGNRKYWNGYSEDERNTFLGNLLETAGYYVKDQTRWSISGKGKSAGEIDLFICHRNGTPFTLIEALNLESLWQDYLILHIDKLFNYDANGNKSNFIIVYYDGPNFEAFSKRYFDFVSSYTYSYMLLRINEILDYSYSEIKFFESAHTRNSSETILNHIIINLRNR